MASSSPRSLRFVHWASTLLLVAGEGWLALQYLAQGPRVTDAVETLGYPIYFMKILAVAKLLGVAALVMRLSPVFKEWAYAGFAFEACGAFASHLSVDDSLGVGLTALALLLLQLISYVCWKQLRQQRALRRQRHAWGWRRRAAESHA